MKRPLTKRSIKKIDQSDMLGLLEDFPQQCLNASRIAQHARILFPQRDFQKVVFCGLGGSAIGADLAANYLYFESNLTLSVIREYQLPGYVDSSTLVFILSYSGNTEETISAYSQAKKRGSQIIVISSGGKLKDYASGEGITFIEMPKGLPPRCALGYLSLIPLCTLAKLGLIKEVQPEINQAAAVLEELKNKSLSRRISLRDNLAKSIASQLWNKFVVIYSASIHFAVVAKRLRAQLNENSKALASSHVFPEMNHNEIVGWHNPQNLFKNFVVLMLKDKGVYPATAKRMDITSEILRKEGVKVIEIESRGENLLSRIFSLIYIGDFVSYYLAILYGIDPTPVERVVYLKKKLAQG